MSHFSPDRPFQNPAPRRSTVDIEEQRAWVGLYRRVVRDAALAAEVLAQLDGDAELKRRHLALYLSCKRSLRVHKSRQARDKRIGQWLRLLVQWALLRPVGFVGNLAQSVYHRSADILHEAIAAEQQASSPTLERGARAASRSDSRDRVEAATAQVRSLRGHVEVAVEQARFQQQAGLSAVCQVSSVSGSECGSECPSKPRDDGRAPDVQVSRH